MEGYHVTHISKLSLWKWIVFNIWN